MLARFRRHLVAKTLRNSLMLLKYALSVNWWSCGLLPQLTVVKFCLNNMVNLRPLTSHIMSSYTHKMVIVSWPQILWRHFVLCINCIHVLSVYSVCLYSVLYMLMFCIIFVYCTVTYLALWLQQTNKVNLLNYSVTLRHSRLLYLAPRGRVRKWCSV